MLKLPKFPISCRTKAGESFKALFKPTGDPRTINVTLTSKKRQAQTTIPAPKEEVLSWAALAFKAYKQCFPEVPVANLFVADQTTNGIDKEDVEQTPLLPLSAKLILAKNAKLGETYFTARNPNPAKQFLCRFEGPRGSEFTLNVYYPKSKQWTLVDVEGKYELRNLTTQEKEAMPTKTPKASKPAMPAKVPTPAPKPQTASKNAPQAHSSNGLSVYEAWGKAFQAHGTKPDAPKLIVEFMTKQFPGRKTSWAKWVNGVRARYNSGKLPGVPAPTEKIKVYK